MFLITAQSNIALKCYTGKTTKGKERRGKIKQTDCGDVFNQCVTLNYEVTLWGHTQKFTDARCTSNNLKCQHCSFLEDNVSGIKECNVSICALCASGTS